MDDDATGEKVASRRGPGDQPARIVLALGGNALLRATGRGTYEDQLAAIEATAASVVIVFLIFYLRACMSKLRRVSVGSALFADGRCTPPVERCASTSGGRWRNHGTGPVRSSVTPFLN